MDTYEYRSGDRVKVGDRVKITCPEDRNFYRRIGVVRLIVDKSREHNFGTIFVQMVRSKGGMWWSPNYIRRIPPLKKRAKKPVLKNSK